MMRYCGVNDSGMQHKYRRNDSGMQQECSWKGMEDRDEDRIPE